MKRAQNNLVLKAARHIEKDAEELRRSSSVPDSDPPVWIDKTDRQHYTAWRRLAHRLRAMLLEDKS